MKKIVLGLAAMALIFSSCSKDETTSVNNLGDPNAMGFEVGTGKQTRGKTTDLTILKGEAGFGVYANKGGSELIDNDAYSWQTDKWFWKENAHKWSEVSVYPITFYAYHPISSATLDSDLKQEYTVKNAVAAQEDYLAAVGTANSRPVTGKIALNFNHIMSKVDFAITTGVVAKDATDDTDTDKNVTVSIQSITVKNVFKTRTFDFSSFAWTGDATVAMSYAYPIVATTTYAEKTTAFDIVVTDDEEMILMPQVLYDETWGVTTAPATTEKYIEVVYRAWYTDKTGAVQDLVGKGGAGATKGDNRYVKVGFPFPENHNWEQSKKYKYILALGDPTKSGGYLTDEKFIDESGDSTAEDVVDPDGVEKNIPEPIFDEYIGFYVDVLGWGDPVETVLQ